MESRNPTRARRCATWTHSFPRQCADRTARDFLSHYDDAHARDKSLYLSWLADSYLAAGEIEQAAAITGRALELSAGVAFVRSRRRLAPILQHLSAHRELPTVAEVLEKART